MTGSERFSYRGEELDLFARAANWKAYLESEIRPFLGADILEVGAGTGTTALALISPAQRSWTALEPDPSLASRVRAEFASRGLAERCSVQTSTLSGFDTHELFDSILYVDVLEHIEDDIGELKRAAAKLRPGGHLIVLAPAHQWLYSPFDRAIGHYRRYSAGRLRAAGPAGMVLVRLRYLDSIGLWASVGNRALLRQAQPTAAQIAAWDRLMVPVSRVLDRIAGHRLGKSVLAVWRAPGDSVAVGSRG